jgi:Arm DNA-binding domain
VTLGPYPRLSLKEARESARETLRIASEGGDPAGDRVTLAKLKGTPIKVPRDTFEAVLERFVASQKRKGRRSADETRRILEKDALPYWRGRPIETITPADVLER